MRGQRKTAAVAESVPLADRDLVAVRQVGAEIDLCGDHAIVRVARLPISHVRRRPVRYKRLFDVVVASLALVALLPLMTLVAFLVLTTSRGPVLYRSERWGHRGSTFGAIKFRSMCADADAALAAAMASDPETAAEYQESFKLQRDPRVTRVGRVLRRYSLDEMPQLVNVLRGEMSIVGPRPKLIEEAARYGPDLEAVLSVRPGLTGLWQVSGRNEVDYAERIQLDLTYVEKASLRLDLAICGRTIEQVLAGTGSY